MMPFYLKDASYSEPSEPLYYLLAGDGLYVSRRNRFFTTQLRVQGLPGLQSHAEKVQLHLPAKLPEHLLTQAVAFFRTVFERFDSEAILLLYYAADEERYELVAPKQEVTPLTCHYDIEATPSGWLRVGSLHSHGALQAGHSDVDARDERHEDGLHFTIGNLDRLPTVSCELAVDGRRLEVPLGDVVDLSSEAEVPAKWLDAVSGNPRS